MNDIEWLAKWYQSNCDGSWEHSYGIKIETLDNPGWHVKIDLSETDDFDVMAQEFSEDLDDNNWVDCSISNGIFNGYGDCMKLERIIRIFKSWIKSDKLTH